MTKRSNGDLVVAGAGADGHGVLCGYRGDGAMQRSMLADLARQAGLPAQWLPPAKDARVQLQRAVSSVAASAGLSAERELKRGRTDSAPWVSRWTLVSASTNGFVVGAAFGTIVLVVTLTDDGVLTFETEDDALEIFIRTEYERRIGAELYQASDVTRWLHEIHRDRLGGVRVGTGWYVPRAKRQFAEAIADAFWEGARWGDAWMSPPLPVASSAQLAVSIANGLIGEVGDVLADLNNQRAQRRRDHGPAADIGPGAAESFMVRFRYVEARVKAYAELLGPERTNECIFAIADAMVELDGVLDGGVTAALESFRTARELEAA